MKRKSRRKLHTSEKKSQTYKKFDKRWQTSVKVSQKVANEWKESDKLVKKSYKKWQTSEEKSETSKKEVTN